MESSNLTNETQSRRTSYRCFFLEAVFFDRNDDALFISSIITLMLNAVFGIVALCGNIVFIISLWKTKTLHTCSNLLLGNLAISDLLVGVLVQPLYVAYKAGELNGKYTCLVHVSFSTLAWLAAGVSFLTLTTISFERYIAILKPFFYLKKILQEKNVVVVSVFIWLFSLILVFSRFVGVSTFLFYVVCCTIIVLSFTTTTFIYIKIFRLAKLHHKSIIDTRHQESVKNGQQLQENKLTKTVGLVTGIFFLSYVPTLCIMVFYSIRGYGRVVKTIYSWTDTILFVNSSLNPFIYYMRNQQIRQAVLDMLKRIKIYKSPGSLQPTTVSFSRKCGIIKITKQANQEIPDALK